MLRFELLGLKKGYLFSLIRSQVFFTLLPEHGHAVGEFVAFSADVGELLFFLNAPDGRVTVLDNFQVLDQSVGIMRSASGALPARNESRHAGLAPRRFD